MRKFIVTLIFLTLPSFVALSSIPQSSYDLYQKALTKEKAEGNLEEAIALFQKVVDKGDDEALAAQAQFHIGICYEKLGLDKARESYEKVIERYPKQGEVVKAAREKLAVLSGPGAAAEKNDKAFRLRQVWAGPDVSLGEVSPDGKSISFVDWETGDLAVREVATGKKRRLTDKGPWTKSSEFVLFSTWAPDNRQIAYNWYNEKDQIFELRAIDIENLRVRVLVTNKEFTWVYPGDWSPDGKLILTYVSRSDGASELGLVSVEDKSLRILRPLGKSAPTVMKFSPDGRFFAFDLASQDNILQRDIFLRSTDGRSEALLVRHPADDYLIDWAPAGDGVIFLSDRSGTADVWHIRIANGNPQGEPDLVRKDAGAIWPMGMTAAGAVYYYVQTSAADIYFATLDTDRGKVVSPPAKAIQRNVGSNICPDWSHDGKTLAYLTSRGSTLDPTGLRILCLRSLDTGKERQISPPPHVRTFWGQLVRWSPDGGSILIGGMDLEGQRRLYILDSNSGETSGPIDTAGLVLDGDWAADGRSVFYTEMDLKTNTARIVALDVGSRQIREIYQSKVVPPNPTGVTKIALSPDGRQIAFLEWRSIKTIPAQGGEAREIYKAQASETLNSLEWFPDGKSVLISKRTSFNVQDQGAEIWKAPAEGGEATSMGIKMDRLGSIRIHPDGKRIAFVAGMGQGEVWTMQNFLHERRGKK